MVNPLPYRSTCDKTGHWFPKDLKTREGNWVCARCDQVRDSKGQVVNQPGVRQARP